MKKTLVIAVLAGMTLSASAQLDGLYYGGGSPVWPATSLNANSYVDLANNYSAGAGSQFFGAKASGGVDVIANYGSGWGTYPIVSGTYQALTTAYATANQAFGAKAGGGVDAIYYSGGWTATPVNPHSFVSLANVNAVNQFMGVRSAGSLEFTYYSSGWFNYTVGSGSYQKVINDPMNATSVYALRADGGIDRVTFNGSAWVTTTVDHTQTYVALTADSVVANWVYGATAGGLYGIVDAGSGFGAPTLMNANSYKELEDITGAANQLFGARADGTGLDAVYFNGSVWVNYQANPNDYGVLLHDSNNGNLYASVVPEPGTMSMLGLGGLILLYWRKKIQAGSSAK